MVIVWEGPTSARNQTVSKDHKIAGRCKDNPVCCKTTQGMDDATAQLATTGIQGQESLLRSLCSITGLPGDSWLSQAPMKRYAMVKISEDSFLSSIYHHLLSICQSAVFECVWCDFDYVWIWENFPMRSPFAKVVVSGVSQVAGLGTLLRSLSTVYHWPFQWLILIDPLNYESCHIIMSCTVETQCINNHSFSGCFSYFIVHLVETQNPTAPLHHTSRRPHQVSRATKHQAPP